MYRDEIYSLQILLSRTQAEPGRAVKKEQEEISPNHVRRINLISVLSNLQRQNEILGENQQFLLLCWATLKDDSEKDHQLAKCTCMHALCPPPLRTYLIISPDMYVFA